MKKEYLMAGVTVFCWGTLPSITNTLLQDMSNMTVLFIGSVIAFLTLLTAVLFTPRRKLLKTYTREDYLHLVCLGFLGNFLYSALYYYGLSVLSAQDACVVNYLWPLMTVILSCIILKERLTPATICAALLSFAGVIFVATKGQIGMGFNKDVLGGILSCIAAAFCYGLFNILNKLKNKDQVVSYMVYFLTTTLCSAVISLISSSRPQLFSLSISQIAGFLWLGIFINAVAYLLWGMALQQSQASSIVNFAYATPVLSMIISVLFFKESLNIFSIIGLLFILGGILLQLKQKLPEQNMISHDNSSMP